jgi:glycosyltransferase involved in cell wall biosynthesis
MLKRPDCSSSMLVRYNESSDSSVRVVRLSTSFPLRVRRVLERRRVSRERVRYSHALAKVELFSDDRGFWADNVAANLAEFDILQLHWVCDFLNYRRFFKAVPEAVPLVWRLADMNPLTGGCHYDGGCGRFAQSCGCCPKLESRQELDWSRAIWNRKKAGLEALSSERLHIVALNQWMAGQVARSSLLSRFECSIIPNGVDLDEFRPIPPAAAREALGIPSGREVLAFVADGVTNVRKGFALLLDALDCLRERRNLFLLVVGDTRHLPRLSLPSLRVGHVQSVIFLRQIYSAAHVFVIPSLEDNQPNTVLEAMACGMPVVGFKVGGIPEIVEDGGTGLLVPGGNVPELAQAIEYLLDHEAERAAMATQARRRAEAVFSRAEQVRRYLELYSRLIAKLETKTSLGQRTRANIPSAVQGSNRGVARANA